MLLSNEQVDRFLCVARNLKLSLSFDSYSIYLVPYQAHFVVHVDYQNNEIYDNWFNTWDEAYKDYQNQCSKYIVDCTQRMEDENSSNTYDDDLPF